MSVGFRDITGLTVWRWQVSTETTRTANTISMTSAIYAVSATKAVSASVGTRGVSVTKETRQ